MQDNELAFFRSFVIQKRKGLRINPDFCKLDEELKSGESLQFLPRPLSHHEKSALPDGSKAWKKYSKGYDKLDFRNGDVVSGDEYENDDETDDGRKLVVEEATQTCFDSDWPDLAGSDEDSSSWGEAPSVVQCTLEWWRERIIFSWPGKLTSNLGNSS